MCLFVSAGEVGDTRAMWLDELSLLLLAGEAREIEALGARWPLTSRDERERAFRQLRPLFKSLAGGATRPGDGGDPGRSTRPTSRGG